MKKIFTVIAMLLLGTSIYAQTPEKMSYQAVVRNASNGLISNQQVGMKISILQGSANGTAVYVETQTPTANANGLVSLEIGGGSVLSGIFSAINWANGPFFIKTETDPTGGTAYSLISTSQLLSTPYALYAKTSGSSTPGPQGPQGIQGVPGLQGVAGTNGQGVPTGGTANQVLAKVDGTNFNTKWVTPASGGGATMQLLANKVGGTSESLPLAGSISPTQIIYNNALVTAFGATGNTYNAANSTFTVGPNGAGLYYIQSYVRTPDAAVASQTVPVWMMIEINNQAYGSDTNIYGQYPTLMTVQPTGMKGRGEITTVTYLNAGDSFKIKATSANSSTASQPINANAGSNLMVVKL